LDVKGVVPYSSKDSFDVTKKAAQSNRVYIEDFYLIEYLPLMDARTASDTEVDKIAFRRSFVEKRLRAKPVDLLALRHAGMSMYPELEDGSTIVIDRARTRPGLDKEIFVVQVEEEILCKYLQRTGPSTLRISSANEKYEAIDLPSERVKVLGQVVWNDRTRV
jgi:phage repressor protein C with HTH and peptisase S24 domain